MRRVLGVALSCAFILAIATAADARDRHGRGGRDFGRSSRVLGARSAFFNGGSFSDRRDNYGRFRSDFAHRQNAERLFLLRRLRDEQRAARFRAVDPRFFGYQRGFRGFQSGDRCRR